MKNTLKINHEKGTITMDRTFAKKAENTMSAEYAHLQNVRRDYPTYTVVRREIKKNPNKECYKGLTYEYMESYISMVDEDGSLMKDFQCLRQGCNYAVVKKWFLTALPEINNFAA